MSHLLRHLVQLPVIVLLLALARSLAVGAVNVFVSPAGDDANPGSAQKPVASLAAAQSLARQATRQGAVTIHLHGGVYYVPETLVFTAADSGSVWQAMDDETPVISGGQKLSLAWERAAHRAGVFQARVPAGMEIDQLWVNGARQWMARFPNRESGADLNVFDTWKLDHRARPDPTRDPLAANRIALWSDPAGAFLHGMHPALWGGIHWRVTGRNPEGKLALEGGTQNNRGSGLHGTYRFVENVFEELDQPGEWFHDRKTDTLFYFPPAGMDLAKATIETVRLRQLIELRGSSAQPVKHLTLRGLTFRHAARTFMETKEPLLRSDWTIYRGGAVMMTGAEDCAIEDCAFDQVGGNAIFVSNYNRRLIIRGCQIAEAGANGICFVGDPAAVRNPLFQYDQRLTFANLDRTPGPKSDNFPAECLVDNCLIYRSGRVEKQTAPVEIDMAQSITVRHCSIYDVPRAGINIGDGCWGGHVIEFCDIFDTVKETGDHGSFNSWGRDRFWPGGNFKLNDDASWATNRELPFLDVTRPIVLRNNRWRCDHGWDIDLDDGSSHYEIRNNLCLGGGIKNREGFGRIVENNVMAASGFHPHVWFKHSGDVFRRNVIAATAYFPALMGPPPWGREMDYNLVHVSGKTNAEPAVNLARQSGGDRHSIAADAQFVNAARGDFRVSEGSPALALGFTNFPMDQFGVQKPALRAMARTPAFSARRNATASMFRSNAVDWLGAKVKNLETIEEASSVGVALSQGGVLVIEVPASARAAGLGLRRGDLIVAIGGKPLKDLEKLKTISALADIDVIRDQRRLRLERGSGTIQ